MRAIAKNMCEEFKSSLGDLDTLSTSQGCYEDKMGRGSNQGMSPVSSLCKGGIEVTTEMLPSMPEWWHAGSKMLLFRV